MAIMIDAPRQRQQQEREGILELLARGLAQGAGQSLGTGLGNLATQGLGMLIDPNQRPLDAQSLQLMGIDPAQAQSIAAIRNPAVQRDILLAQQQRAAEQQQLQQKQARSEQYLNAIKMMSGQNQAAAGQGPSQPGNQGVPEADMSSLEIADLKDLAKYSQKERHENAKETRSSWKDLNPYITKAREQAEAAEKGEGAVNVMERLQKGGKLDEGPIAAILAKHGLDYFLSEDTQLFEKLRAGFMSGAQKAIGGRVSNYELESFMKSIPSLMQTSAGRQLIIDQMKKSYAIDKQYYKKIRELRKEYEGKSAPNNFEDIVYERMQPYYKEFQEQFKTEPMKESAQKRFETKPDAVLLVGKKIRNPVTGEVLISNGKEWVPVKKEVEVIAKPMTRASGNKYGYNADEI